MCNTICIAANTLHYSQGGGHFWVHLNWALGFKANGCKVIWLEKVRKEDLPSLSKVKEWIHSLKNKLAKYEFYDVALFVEGNEVLPPDILAETCGLAAVYESDLLFNMRYDVSNDIVKQFKRSVLLDIDPGLFQLYVAKGIINLAKHDLYFSIGETVGTPAATFPAAGIRWLYTQPSIDTNYWVQNSSSEDAAFTTISHWNTDQWIVKDDGEFYSNDKRDGFLPFLDLPKRTTEKLELALCLNGDKEEKDFLLQRGWAVRESWEVSNTPEAYQNYIQNSKGEFSCVKPHYVRFNTAWISDRTLCYLASGKPAIVQHTGESSFLPDDAGLLRFKSFNEALKCIEEVGKNYHKHSSLARAFAEEYFDAKKVTKSLLERTL